MKKFILNPGKLSLLDIKQLLNESITLELNPDAHDKIDAAEEIIIDALTKNTPVYGLNTGFGALANTQINADDLEKLQHRIILSHAAGTGDCLSDEIVRLIIILKINSLACGYSGVRLKTIDALIRLVNAHVYPCIPAQGSVGASGDLAPLAHMSAALLGVSDVRYQGKIIPAAEGLKIAGLEPLTLAPKEGLALINGTQVSTAIALSGLCRAYTVFNAALIAGAMSVDAAMGSHQPFDERIQEVRKHRGQINVARILRDLLNDSAISKTHHDHKKVQDPYSLRCQPQVMGACLNHLEFVSETLVNEANAVTDNPLIFADDHVILSGGNFHAEPVAMAADTLAIAIAEIGALSERRIALLIDPNMSRLPAFLVNQAGLNSGFMLAQVTAAAVASENKSLAHPASVDSIPTSANQEDHVSMATFAARRLLPMCDNTATIVAIELLAACQGIDFRRPLKTSTPLEKIHRLIREHVSFYAEDRYFAPDIAAVKKLIKEGKIHFNP